MTRPRSKLQSLLANLTATGGGTSDSTLDPHMFVEDPEWENDTFQEDFDQQTARGGTCIETAHILGEREGCTDI